MRVEHSDQQPCVHCGDCARACPEALNPEVLFFTLVEDDFAAAGAARLEACGDCNRCTEVCPSHIPLRDWLRWGRSEMLVLARAEDARKRFLARNVRLARERAERAARREAPSTTALPVQMISRNEVLAAIARGKAKRRGQRP